MNRDVLVKQFQEAVREMKQTHSDGTRYWKLDVDDNKNQWAVVLGWQDCGEEIGEDEYTDGKYRLCAKLAYQPVNSAMQCDYDVDWLMPCNKEIGEAYDSEIALYPESEVGEVVDWLLSCYKDAKEQFDFYNKEKETVEDVERE